MTSSLRVATSILLVKDRIQQYYAQDAQLRASLNKYKAKHGYCQGQASCMTTVKPGVRLCEECERNHLNPRYKRKLSEYGRIRMKEREEERKKKAVKKTKAKPEKKAA